MIDHLTVLRVERASAAEALRRVRGADCDGALGRQDQIDKLARTIDRLDRAIAQWDVATLRIA